MKKHIIGSIIVKRFTDLNVSLDFLEGLDKFIVKSIKEAEIKAENNGRKTLMARDL